MSVNFQRTQNAHPHRHRRRRRTTLASTRLRKFQHYLLIQSIRITSIVGVTSVTQAEILAAHNTPQSVRGRYVRDSRTPADVTALGIDIA
ncbi:MAG: hypothetical protein KAI41_01275 [Hyphomicrobiaceae bacterium]|nr:hypothetical protein [Hyphomicrobiaceae bacterium]MCK5549143.1 hypothetical protein [Hyphomicrobiaceae bacterium]